MANTQESSTVMEMFMEYDEKYRIAQEERYEKARIAQKTWRKVSERSMERVIAKWMAMDGASRW